MKNIVKTVLAFAASAAMFAACDLNLVPTNAIAYEEGGQLIKTASNLTSFENGILADFRSISIAGFTVAEEVQCDYFNAAVDYGNNYGSTHRCDKTFTASDYDVEDLWAYNYSAITDFNIMIANADNVPEDLVEKAKVVKGEAFFFRAYSYLTLARHFGPAYTKDANANCVPLVLVYDQLAKPARATVKEVYAQIKSDLDSAAVLLAGVAGKAASQKPTIDAVNALYARYYIDINDNANAALYAHKVIDGGTYALASTQADMTKQFVNDEGKEAIFQLYESLTEGGQALPDWTNSAKDAQGATGQVFRPYYLPTKALVEAYEPEDLRFTTWFDNTETVQIAGNYFNGDFYTFVKFWGNPTLTTNLRNGRQCPKIFRIAEMYLIAAEAELTTNPAAAKADLNAVQGARNATLTDATTQTVQKEWFKEMVGEGHRFTCLKRWGLGFSGRAEQDGCSNVIMTQGDSYQKKVLPASSTYYVWPIPSHEINLNKNLVQNPGYDSL